MITELEISQWTVKYLRGDLPLDEFEDWLVQRSWNMHADSSKAAQELVSFIELRLAEHSAGHLSEEDLRKEIEERIPLMHQMFTILFDQSVSGSVFTLSEAQLVIPETADISPGLVR